MPVIFSFFSILWATFLLFPSGVRPAQVVERIVALVNNQVITQSELEEAGHQLFEQVKASALPSERPEKLRQARRQLLDQLVEHKLLEEEMRRKKVEVSERDVDLAIEDIMKQNRLNENELKAVLAKDGITYSTYRQRIHDDLGKMRLVNREIKSKIVVKDEDLRKTYREQIRSYMEPEEVKVQQIFLPVPWKGTPEEVEARRREALSILGKARNGEDFAELARTYSSGPEAREGGVLGYFKRQELLPALEEAAFKLTPGQLSDVLRSPEGFHILRLLEKRGGEPKPFAEVQHRIREEILQAESERQFQEWIKDLKAKAYVEIRL